MKNSSCAMLISVFVFFSALPAHAARLAVIATDTDAGIQSVSDLLGLELGKHAGVEMVERSELDRVLREQNLAAGSLARSGERMSLGRILKADALVLLRQGRAREGAPQQLDARLVETDTGYLLGRWTLPLGQGALAEVAAALVPEIGNGLRKLGLGKADRILVSVACVFNSTMADEYFWIENEMPGMLESGLMSAERIVALERRDLNNLLTERQVAQWEGGELEGAAVILNGDIRLKSGEKMAAKPEERVVEFTLRIRGNDLKELDRVVEVGKLKELEEITARIVAGVSEILGEIGAEMGWDMSKADTKVEAGVFLDLAKRGGWTWAAEAAHALDVKDKAAAAELIVKLSAEACSGTSQNEDPFDLSEIKERARKLARAVEFCKALKLHPLKTIFSGSVNVYGVRGFLKDPRIKLDDETVEILRPVRQVFRSLAEGYWYGTPAYALALIDGAIEDPDEFLIYAAGMIERTLDKKDLNYGKRMCEVCKIIFQVAGYSGSPLSYSLLDEIGEVFDPEMGMAAYKSLCDMTRENPERKREYARKALEKSVHTFRDVDFINLMSSIGSNGHIEMINEMLSIAPEMRPFLSRAIGRQVEKMLREKGFDETARSICVSEIHCTISNLEFSKRVNASKYLDLLTRQSQRELVANAFDIAKDNPPAQNTGEKLLNFFIQRGEELGMIMVDQGHEYETWEVLSGDSPQWLSVSGDFPFHPSKLILDGTILWVLLRSNVMKIGANVGLLKFDLRTGKILSFQGGTIKTQSSLRGMVLWDDIVCVGIQPLGILLFPANPKSRASDLRDVYVLDKTSGLDVNEFMAFAPVSDDLYVAEPRGLLKWNRRDKTTELVATVSKQMDESMPLNDSGKIQGLKSVGNNRHLRVLCEKKEWLFDTREKKWEQYEDASLLTDDDMSNWPIPYYVKHDFGSKIKCPQGVIWIESVPDSNGLQNDYYIEVQQRILISTFKSDRDKMFAWARPDTLTLERVEETDRIEMESRFLDASIWGQESEAEELLAKGVNINIRDKGYEPDWGRRDLIKSEGLDITTIERIEGETALINAIMFGHTNLAIRLIEKGADIFLANKRGTTPLYAAAMRGNLPVLRKLVDMGGDVNMVRPNSTTPIMAAAWRANLETVKFLLNKGAKLQGLFGESSILIQAAENPDSEVLKFLLQTARNIDVRNENGYTPLALALESGLMENARILLEAGADIHVRNNYDMDILGRCAVMGQIEAVAFCLERGLPINRPHAEKGMTPLMLAAWNGHDKVMRYLIEHGADIEAWDKERKRRVICSVDANSPKKRACINALLDADADITTPCERGSPMKRIGLRDDIVAVLYSDRQLFEKYACKAGK